MSTTHPPPPPPPPPPFHPKLITQKNSFSIWFRFLRFFLFTPVRHPLSLNQSHHQLYQPHTYSISNFFIISIHSPLHFSSYFTIFNFFLPLCNGHLTVWNSKFHYKYLTFFIFFHTLFNLHLKNSFYLLSCCL